jgi:hypothetical protein
MELYLPGPEPGSATPGKIRRFGELRKSQERHIKSPGLVFFPGRHGNLDVIDRKYFHG